MRLRVRMPDRQERELRVEIGDAEPVGEQGWSCRVVLHGAHGDLGEIMAHGRRQARVAAAQMVVLLLRKMERAGHRFFLEEREVHVAELRF